MSEFAITVEALSKRYFVRTAAHSERMEVAFERWLEHQRSLGRHLLRRLSGRTGAARPRRPAKTREFWALKDISFTVRQGEVLGILGPNGAGKSTLLKILSEITPPTRGRVTITGQVGSLLDSEAALSQTPIRWTYLPVMNDARDGTQSGELQYVFSKRTPRSRNA